MHGALDWHRSDSLAWASADPIHAQLVAVTGGSQYFLSWLDAICRPIVAEVRQGTYCTCLGTPGIRVIYTGKSLGGCCACFGQAILLVYLRMVVDGRMASCQMADDSNPQFLGRLKSREDADCTSAGICWTCPRIWSEL